MNTKTISLQFDIDKSEFEAFLTENHLKFSRSVLSGITIDDFNVDSYVSMFKLEMEKQAKKRAEEKAKQEAEEKEKRQAEEAARQKAEQLAREKEKREMEKENMIKLIPVVTTDELNGAVDSVLLSVTKRVDTGYAAMGQYINSIEAAKKEAINDLRNQAFENNCRAVVGIRFEFIHFVVDGYVNTFISAYATGTK